MSVNDAYDPGGMVRIGFSSDVRRTSMGPGLPAISARNWRGVWTALEPTWLIDMPARRPADQAGPGRDSSGCCRRVQVDGSLPAEVGN